MRLHCWNTCGLRSSATTDVSRCAGEAFPKDLLHRLHADVVERLRDAFAPGSKEVLNTVLRAFDRFARACPQRQLFKSPRHQGDSEASAWNEWTLILFAQFLVHAPSRKTKRPLKAATVESYLSLLKGYLNHTYTFELVEHSPRLRRLVKSLYAADPLADVRKKRRGLRRQHLLDMWKTVPKARGTRPNEVNDQALLTVAWHVLARGGELAPQVKAAQWSAERHPTRGDVEFRTSRTHGPYAVLWLRPLKKGSKLGATKVPQYIVRHDGRGDDAYMMLRRLFEFDPVPKGEERATPLFRRRPGGKSGAVPVPMTVGMVRALVRSRMRALGETEMKHWGAHSCRIGGATDLSTAPGTSALLLQARGRWASDIGKIYSRLTRQALLETSGMMYGAKKGRDLEELLPSFVQPA